MAKTIFVGMFLTTLRIDHLAKTCQSCLWIMSINSTVYQLEHLVRLNTFITNTRQFRNSNGQHYMCNIACSIGRKCRTVGMWCSHIIVECSTHRLSVWWQYSCSCRLRPICLVRHCTTSSSCYYCSWRYSLSRFCSYCQRSTTKDMWLILMLFCRVCCLTCFVMLYQYDLRATLAARGRLNVWIFCIHC